MTGEANSTYWNVGQLSGYLVLSAIGRFRFPWRGLRLQMYVATQFCNDNVHNSPKSRSSIEDIPKTETSTSLRHLVLSVIFLLLFSSFSGGSFSAVARTLHPARFWKMRPVTFSAFFASPLSRCSTLMLMSACAMLELRSYRSTHLVNDLAVYSFFSIVLFLILFFEDSGRHSACVSFRIILLTSIRLHVLSTLFRKDLRFKKAVSFQSCWTLVTFSA